MAKTYKSRALAEAHENASDLYRVGLIDKKTMQNFDRSCLTPVKVLKLAPLKRQPMARSESASSKTRHEKPAKKQKVPELGSADQIWSSMLDGRYAVAVRRLQFSSGELTIREGKNLIHRQKVHLMYGAIFGADVDDVATWNEIATKVVDGLTSAPKLPTKNKSAGGPVE